MGLGPALKPVTSVTSGDRGGEKPSRETEKTPRVTSHFKGVRRHMASWPQQEQHWNPSLTLQGNRPISPLRTPAFPLPSPAFRSLPTRVSTQPPSHPTGSTSRAASPGALPGAQWNVTTPLPWPRLLRTLCPWNSTDARVSPCELGALGAAPLSDFPQATCTHPSAHEPPSALRARRCVCEVLGIPGDCDVVSSSPALF